MNREVQTLLALADREYCAGYIRIARELREKAARLMERK